MPEAKSKFLDRILEPEGDRKSFSSERQLTAQAFNLHVERRDGRQSEGFAWSHYAGYKWTDEGERERLVVLFGTRAVEIVGRNLGVLVDEIRDGQLNSVRELASRQKTLLENANPDNEPIIESVKSYPDFEEILREIKGEDDDKRQYVRRIAGR